MTSARLALDDIDDIAVELAVQGRRSGPLNRGERHEAIRQMNRLGYSDLVIAHHIGHSERTVVRDRVDLGIPAVPTDRQINMSDLGLTPDDIRPVGTAKAAEPQTIARMLEAASGHESARVRSLGAKIEDHLDQLRALLAKDAEREKARAEVERLERELAAAKARLKGKAPVAAVASGPRRLCVDCGHEVIRQPGQRGASPKRCNDCKENAA